MPALFWRKTPLRKSSPQGGKQKACRESVPRSPRAPTRSTKTISDPAPFSVLLSPEICNGAGKRHGEGTRRLPSWAEHEAFKENIPDLTEEQKIFLKKCRNGFRREKDGSSTCGP